MLYKVYESMNRIWLERSSNNGSTWLLMNGGEPIDITSGGRYPTISVVDGSLNFVIVYNLSGNLRVQRWSSTGTMLSDYEVTTGNNVSSSSVPVVSHNPDGKVLIAWVHNGVVKYQLGGNSGQWYFSSPKTLTSSNSNNVSISKVSNSAFHLAWQEGWTNIKYAKLNIISGGTNISVSDQATISTGGGYPTNYYPSITTSSSGNPIVAWVGSPYYGASGKIMKRSKGSSGWNSYFGQYGSNNASYPQINMGGSTDVVAWTENSGAVKFVKPFGGVTTFGASGSYIQLANSSSINSMYGSVQNNSSSPYTFTTTSSVGSLSKTSSISLNIGRGFVITKDSSQFFFIMGDVALSGEGIGFEELPAELIIKEKSELDKYLLTEPFQFSDSDELEFSLLLGVSDSIAAKSVFRKNEKIKFSFELIEDATNKVLGKYEKFVQRKDDILTNESRTFKLDGKGIGDKFVKLKMIFDTEIKGEYTLLDIRDNTTVLPKIGESAVSISYAGELEIKDYTLSQNFPNPFNPSTVINYQIPNDGLVSLKVYDITGQEVATLVNQAQAKGRYEISFPTNGGASKLSSGVYLYRLTSGSFTKSMKMLLLK